MPPNFFSKSLFIFVIVFGICTILNFLFSVLVFDRVGIALLPGGLIALASAVYSYLHALHRYIAELETRISDLEEKTRRL